MGVYPKAVKLPAFNAYPDGKPHRRLCLRCERDFWSKTKFNRLCQFCQKSTESLVTGEVATHHSRSRGGNASQSWRITLA